MRAPQLGQCVTATARRGFIRPGGISALVDSSCRSYGRACNRSSHISAHSAVSHDPEGTHSCCDRRDLRSAFSVDERSRNRRWAALRDLDSFRSRNIPLVALAEQNKMLLAHRIIPGAMLFGVHKRSRDTQRPASPCLAGSRRTRRGLIAVERYLVSHGTFIARCPEQVLIVLSQEEHDPPFQSFGHPPTGRFLEITFRIASFQLPSIFRTSG